MPSPSYFHFGNPSPNAFGDGIRKFISSAGVDRARQQTHPVRLRQQTLEAQLPALVLGKRRALVACGIVHSARPSRFSACLVFAIWFMRSPFWSAETLDESRRPVP